MLYRKQVYLKNGQGFAPVVVRNYTQQDFDELIQIQRESFPPPFPSDLWWNMEQLENHVTLFPEGALCVEVNGVLAGSMTGLIVHFDKEESSHTWQEMTDDGYIRNHSPDGNTLYVVDICIRPAYRNLALGKLLMQSMYEVVVQLGLERLVGGGRMPGFHRHANRLTPQEYLEEVLRGQLQDPVITFLLHAGRTPIRILENYLEDEQSLHHAVLMEWVNPFMTRLLEI